MFGTCACYSHLVSFLGPWTLDNPVVSVLKRFEITGGAAVFFGGAGVSFGGAWALFGGAWVLFGGAGVSYGGASALIGGASALLGGAGGVVWRGWGVVWRRWGVVWRRLGVVERRGNVVWLLLGPAGSLAPPGFQTKRKLSYNNAFWRCGTSSVRTSGAVSKVHLKLDCTRVLQTNFGAGSFALP